MVAPSYVNTLDYQMTSVLDNKEEDKDNLVTTTAQPEPSATSTVFKSAGLQNQRPAAKILQEAGITSAKDILRTLPEAELDATAGGITASKILEDYRKEQERESQQRFITDIAAKAKTEEFNQKAKEEAELRKKEKDFIANYSLDLTKKNYSYGTRFGNLDIAPEKVTVINNPYATFDVTKDNKTTKVGFGHALLDVPVGQDGQKQDFVFLPFEYISKGMPNGAGGRISTGFLNKETWDAMLKIAQPINLEEAGIFKNYMTGADETFKEGYLFKFDDYEAFNNEYLDNPLVDKNAKFMDAYSFKGDNEDETFNAAFNRPIMGIANFNGSLVYVKENYKQGSGTFYDTYVDNTGRVYSNYYAPAEERGGFAGVLQDVGKAVSKIPFAPEIIGIATGNPAIYASLKSLQTLGLGGSSGDILKAGAVAFATSAIQPQLSGYGESLGSSINAATGNALSSAVATTIGTSVVYAGFNGLMAAATNQDIEDAMLSGAIGGAIGANATTITNTVFGGEANVAALSKTLNLKPAQTAAIFSGALAAGSINAVVKNQDFLDAFTESLMVQGISQSGANTVRNQLGTTLDPKAREAIVSNTRIFLQASARAAVRGEDMETAIKRVAPYLQGRALGQTANILLNKK